MVRLLLHDQSAVGVEGMHDASLGYRAGLYATRARNWLGWEPRAPLSVGLAKTVEYYRQLLAGS